MDTLHYYYTSQHYTSLRFASHFTKLHHAKLRFDDAREYTHTTPRVDVLLAVLEDEPHLST